MSEKYLNKFRNDSARLKGHDYSLPSAYFITVCTKDRLHHFGEIMNGEIILTKIGQMAEKYWYKIPDHFPNVKLDAFVVMPNHIHGIIIICNSVGTPNIFIKTECYNNFINTNKHDNSEKIIGRHYSERTPKNWKPGSLGVIINQYKRMCTIFAHKTKIDFEWQPRFHDHIIRNDDENNRIKNYIINNTNNWKEDGYYLS